MFGEQLAHQNEDSMTTGNALQEYESSVQLQQVLVKQFAGPMWPPRLEFEGPFNFILPSLSFKARFLPLVLGLYVLSGIFLLTEASFFIGLAFLLQTAVLGILWYPLYKLLQSDVHQNTSVYQTCKSAFMSLLGAKMVLLLAETVQYMDYASFHSSRVLDQLKMLVVADVVLQVGIFLLVCVGAVSKWAKETINV